MESRRTHPSLLYTILYSFKIRRRSEFVVSIFYTIVMENFALKTFSLEIRISLFKGLLCKHIRKILCMYAACMHLSMTKKSVL